MFNNAGFGYVGAVEELSDDELREQLEINLGFGGSQAEINQLAPDNRRGEVTAAYVTIIYGGITAAWLAVGTLGDAVGIPGAVAIMAGAVGVIALGAGWWQLRTVPASRR